MWRVSKYISVIYWLIESGFADKSLAKTAVSRHFHFNMPFLGFKMPGVEIVKMLFLRSFRQTFNFGQALILCLISWYFWRSALFGTEITVEKSRRLLASSCRIFKCRWDNIQKLVLKKLKSEECFYSGECESNLYKNRDWTLSRTAWIKKSHPIHHPPNSPLISLSQIVNKIIFREAKKFSQKVFKENSWRDFYLSLKDPVLWYKGHGQPIMA